MGGFPQDDDPDGILFQIKGDTMDAMGKFQEFTVHALVEAIDSGHPVTNLDNGSNAGSFRRRGPAEQDRARENLTAVREEMLSMSEGMLILDEIIYLVSFGLLKEDKLLELIHSKPPALHLILTGRGASPRLIEAAELVTEMISVKHPYNNGAGALKGIEF